MRPPCLLDDPKVWASTKVLWKEIMRQLESGPNALSIDDLCTKTHYSPHTVRAGVQYLLTGKKIRKFESAVADDGVTLYVMSDDLGWGWSRS